MDPKRWNDIRSILDDLLELDPEAREQALERHCRDDEELRSELESLLRAHDDAPDTEEILWDREDAPERIGPYRILERLGEGGMGIVYLADQTEPIRRRVALKLMRHGGDAERAVAEWQTLARLRHPNIAQIYDAGRAADGRPYCVMEYVRGIPITELCDRYRLTVRERLELFLGVCDAMEHSHGRGIIHRDLKPSNVLVETDAKRRTPKVIDFGVARASPDLAVGSYSTSRPLGVAGTPRYMSPEQSNPTPEGVDERSDIYSLGLLLHELLVGALPDQEGGRGTRRRTASERLSSLGEKAVAVAANRRLSSRALRRTLRGELDAIVDKALRLDPAHRYRSAAEFHDQVSRHLAGSFVSRHWPAMAAVLVLFVVTIVVVVETRDPGAGLLNASRVLVVPAEIRGIDETTHPVGLDFSRAVANGLAHTDLDVAPVPRQAKFADLDSSERCERAKELGAGRLVEPVLRTSQRGLISSWTVTDTTGCTVVAGAGRVIRGNYSELASVLAGEIGNQLGGEPRRSYDYVLNLPRDSPVTESALSTQAVGALKREDLAGAVEATAELIDRFPTDPVAWSLRAYALLQAWEIAQARRTDLQQALAMLSAVDPQHPYATLFRAYVKGRQGNPSEAIRDYDRILARPDLRPPARAWVLRYRAQARLVIDHTDTDRALEDLQRARDADPVNAATFAAMSRVLRERGDTDQAIARARQAVELEPDSWSHQLILGMVLMDRASLPEALEAHHKACELSESQVACAAYAMSLVRSGDRVGARSVAETAANMEESRDGQFNLACFWAEEGRLELSIEHLERSVELGYMSERIEEDRSLEVLRGTEAFETLIETIRRQRLDREVGE